jgi:hypothetical protein
VIGVSSWFCPKTTPNQSPIVVFPQNHELTPVSLIDHGVALFPSRIELRTLFRPLGALHFFVGTALHFLIGIHIFPCP